MSESKNIWQNIKLSFGVTSAFVMLTIISYFSISQNHDYYNINEYLNFVGTVAVMCFFLNTLIVGLTYWLSSKDNFLANLDRLSNYFPSVFAIGLIGAGVGSFALLVGKKYSWVEFFGCLLIWGFFLNLYLIISFRLFKRKENNLKRF
jgi:hypothetical protein